MNFSDDNIRLYPHNSRVPLPPKYSTITPPSKQLLQQKRSRKRRRSDNDDSESEPSEMIAEVVTATKSLVGDTITSEKPAHFTNERTTANKYIKIDNTEDQLQTITNLDVPSPLVGNSNNATKDPTAMKLSQKPVTELREYLDEQCNDILPNPEVVIKVQCFNH